MRLPHFVRRNARMDIDRHTQSLGPQQDRFERRIIKEATVCRTIYQEPVEPEILDRPFQFIRRRLGRMHRQMRETAKSAWMTGGGFGQSVVIVPCQSDSLGAWHDVGSWAGDREDLYSDPARIHVRQSRVAEVSQLVPLHDLSPDDVGPRKAAAADGGGVDTADDSRNGVMLFQRDHAHSVSPGSPGASEARLWRLHKPRAFGLGERAPRYTFFVALYRVAAPPIDTFSDAELGHRPQ